MPRHAHQEERRLGWGALASEKEANMCSSNVDPSASRER
jgi:hypothetical protein